MKRILSGIFSILTRQEKVKLFRLILSDLVMGILDVAFLAMILVVINFYTKPDDAAHIPFLPLALLSQNSLWLGGGFLILFAFKNWLGYVNSKFQYRFFYTVSSRLSRQNIQSYLQDDYLHFVHIDSSVLIRKISQQPIEFSNYILTNFQQVVSQSILILFTITGILFYHPALFFLLFVLLLPPVVLLGYFIRKKLKTIRKNIQVTSQKTIQHLQESLSGYIESNIYHKDDFFINRYNQHQQQLNNNIAIQQTLQGLTSRLVEVFAILGFFILVVINKLSAGTPMVNMLTMGVFMAASYKIIPGIVKILNSTGQIKTYQFTLTDLQPVKEPVKAPGNGQKLQSVTFHDVCFKYKEHPVLNGVNFEIHAGEFMGISARSGKGKTTLINILLGFLTQQKGALFFNGTKVNQLERQSYWSRISYVKQQGFLINDTILKNITLADGDHDAAKLAHAIAFCGLDTLTNQYPEGINTFIKENGKNISGGQRQRIMLARAIYHDFDLLILDEAFAEMDEAAENAILDNLKLLTGQGKMIILITHNQQTLLVCDKVISVDKEYA